MKNPNARIVTPEEADKTVDLIRHMTYRADLKTAEGTGEFVGYASTFDPPSEPDRGDDIVNPKAFDASLARWRKRGIWPPLLWQHDWENLAASVGTITDLRTDGRGLVVRGRLDLTHEPSVALYDAMKAGRINGLSFAYDILDKRTVGDGVTELLELELLEVTICLIPMNPNARILVVKSNSERKRLEMEAAWAAHEQPTTTSTSSATASPDGDSDESDELALINARLDEIASGEKVRDPDAAAAVDALVLEVRQELVQEALDRAEQAAWEGRMGVNMVLDPVPVRVDARMRPDR
jgi:HK97 family phage prohead protease